MSRLFIPPRVARELQEESRRRETQALQSLAADHEYRWKKEFDAQLERIVHGMRLAFCPDPAPVDAIGQGASPGRWHLVWPGYSGGPLTIQPLVINAATGEASIGGDGGFVEPGSWVFDRLAATDMWNERAMRDRRRIQEEAEQARRRRREIEAADFDRDCLEHYKAVTRTQISMNTGTPWAQNAAGARRTRGEARKRKDT